MKRISVSRVILVGLLQEDDTIPTNIASVALGLNDSPAFAVQAQKDQTLQLTPDPEYWLATGTFQPGQVLIPSDIANPVAVNFPPGVTAVDAALSADGL